MWPDGSSTWRKRLPSSNTKPRLGNNIKAPFQREPTASVIEQHGHQRPSANLPSPLDLLKRQLDDAGTDNDEDTGAPVASVTYNNGMWTPPVTATPAALTATPAAALAASLITGISEASSISMLSASSLTSSPTSLTSTQTSAPTSVSPSISSQTSSATTSAVPSAQPAKSSGGGGGGFKLVYLTPIAVFVGLLLLFSIGGRIWGRIHHASRLEASRRSRYAARTERAAKRAEMRRVKTMWGYEQTPALPAELQTGEHDLHYSDPNRTRRAEQGEDGNSSLGSDSESGVSEEKYPGTWKILSLALLGEGAKGELPETRGEGGRKYETDVEKNGWFSVKVKRWIGKNEPEPECNTYTASSYWPARRLRNAFSRDRLRQPDFDEKQPSSPATTLSVGSGEMKYKAEFSSIPLHDQDDVFATDYSQSALGIRKPLPPQPKESPFRPGVLTFGLRSRSKTYDPVDPHPAHQTEHGTPSKAAVAETWGAGGFLSGLGISGVWKAVTSLTTPKPDQDDEESFVAHAYRPDSEVMSESDTPYTPTKSGTARYEDQVSPTKATAAAAALGRTGTVLHVKADAAQPWNKEARKITASAWHEALLASPINRSQTQQVAAFQSLAQSTPSPVRENTKKSLEPRKSLLLHQAVKAAAGQVETGASPAFTDYSDLVACYSAPSDAIMSPDAPSIRVLPSKEPAAGKVAEEGARAKLQRAKTAKLSTHPKPDPPSSVQRSKTSSTTTSATTSASSAPGRPTLGPGLSRKSTVHPKQQPAPEPTSPTRPLRLSKPTNSAFAIPTRGSSSPLPSALQIASPEPIPPHIHLHLPSHLHTKQSTSPTRSNPNAASLAASHSTQRRQNALHTVDQILSHSYAAHHQHHSHHQQ